MTELGVGTLARMRVIAFALAGSVPPILPECLPLIPKFGGHPYTLQAHCRGRQPSSLGGLQAGWRLPVSHCKVLSLEPLRV